MSKHDDKTRISELTASGYSFDAIFFCAIDKNSNALQENIGIAINKAIELCKGNIYFEANAPDIYNRYIVDAKDDSNRRSSVINSTIFLSNSGREGQTSLLIEKLMEKTGFINYAQTVHLN